MWGAAVSPVEDDDECEAHAAFLVESEGFGVLDCGATTSFGSVHGAEAFFFKSHEHDTRIPEVDPFGGRSFNFGDGASSKATSLSRLLVRNDALGDFWIPVHLFVRGSAETDSVDAGCGFYQGTALCHRLWQRLDSFPNAVWLLLAFSIGSLHENKDKLLHTGNDCLATFIYQTMSK